MSAHIWRPAGNGVEVHLDYAVVDRLAPEVGRAFTAVKRRGLEVGGVLIGTVERGETRVFRVHDSLLFPCIHERGPSFLLSESEETAFGEALERVKQQGQQVIGYFRSHTRDGMSLAGEDAALLEKHFPDAEAVALLIKPLPARIPSAAFFVREADGSFRHDEPLVEFPFDRKAMRTETGGENRKTDALTSVTPPSALEPSRVDPPPHPTEHPVRQPTAEDSGVVTSNGTRRRFVWPSIAFACLVAGAVLGYVGARSSRSLADALAASQPYGLGLIAESAGDNLHVKWNRDTPTIQEAQRGRLYISDGTFTKAVDLDQGQLRHGSVIYRRLSGRVKFRLEVARPDRLTISETVELSLDPPK